MTNEIHIVLLTIKMALFSLLIIVPIGILIAWLLSKKKWPFQGFFEAILYLPLAIPPVATGILLLSLLSPKTYLGKWLQSINFQIVFTPKAIVLAMTVCSLPFFISLVKNSFDAVPSHLEFVARTLGAKNLKVFFTITLPLSIRGIASGTLLAFSRSIGEFGTTVMLAGNTDINNQTMSIAMYHHFLNGQETIAYRLIIVCLLICFGSIYLQRKLIKK